MLIENIASTNYFSPMNLKKQKENKNFGDYRQPSKKSVYEHDDFYVSSKISTSFEDVQENVKAKNISEIKNRIASGFYDSSAVNDDLTEVFSEIFKKAFS